MKGSEYFITKITSYIKIKGYTYIILVLNYLALKVGYNLQLYYFT